MSENLNGTRATAWSYFKSLVAANLMRAGYYDNLNDGLDFADDLDMSFEELYQGSPRTEWPRLVALQCAEFMSKEGKPNVH